MTAAFAILTPLTIIAGLIYAGVQSYKNARTKREEKTDG